MPFYIFKCEHGHIMEKYKPTPYKNARRYRCPECGLWMYRDYRSEHPGTKNVNLNDDNSPMSHLIKRRSFVGKWIEHLTPEPVFVRDKRQYERLLRKTHSAEARR